MYDTPPEVDTDAGLLVACPDLHRIQACFNVQNVMEFQREQQQERNVRIFKSMFQNIVITMKIATINYVFWVSEGDGNSVVKKVSFLFSMAYVSVQNFAQSAIFTF